ATLTTAALNGSTPPILVYDSTSGLTPNPAGTLEVLTTRPVDTNEHSVLWEYTANADGPLYSLPAGAVRLSVGSEYREEYTDFAGVSAQISPSARDRYSAGYYAETRIPLVSSKQHVSFVTDLEASLAARYDRYADFPSATSPQYGVLFKPTAWLTLR